MTRSDDHDRTTEPPRTIEVRSCDGRFEIETHVAGEHVSTRLTDPDTPIAVPADTAIEIPADDERFGAAMWRLEPDAELETQLLARLPDALRGIDHEWNREVLDVGCTVNGVPYGWLETNTYVGLFDEDDEIWPEWQLVPLSFNEPESLIGTAILTIDMYSKEPEWSGPLFYPQATSEIGVRIADGTAMVWSYTTEGLDYGWIEEFGGLEVSTGYGLDTSKQATIDEWASKLDDRWLAICPFCPEHTMFVLSLRKCSPHVVRAVVDGKFQKCDEHRELRDPNVPEPDSIEPAESWSWVYRNRQR